MGRTNLEQIRQAWQQQLVYFAPYIVCGIILVLLPPFIPPYLQRMLTKALIFGIFAMSLNLILGYTGLLSLGHAVYFGVGGYAAGILMLHYGIESFWLVAPAAILIAVFVAAFFGIIALRVSGIYFLLITFAMGQLLFGIAWKWKAMTGGSDGLTGIPRPDIGIPFTWDAVSFYYFIFLAFVICCFLLYRIVNSPFGYALQGIRDSEQRMRSLGYNTWLYKYLAFIVSGLFAAVAGILFAFFNGLMFPAHLGFTTSALALLMVIIGGAGMLFGPAIGATLIVLLEYFASIYTPERWPLILGATFVIAVMFLRGGVGIYLTTLWNKMRYQYGGTKG